MIRATVGVWLNYATTLAFQVVFALRFGAGADVTAFVLAYTIAVAASGVLIATAQSVVVPRLLGADGRLHRSQIRLLGRLTVAGVGIFIFVGALAGPIAEGVAATTGVRGALLEHLLRAASVFGILQVIAGQLIAVAIAVGRRFVPAAAAACPTLAGAATLIVGSVSLTTLVWVFAAGSVAEVAVLTVAIFDRRAEVADTDTAPAGGVALATAFQFGLLALLPPIETYAASIGSAAGGADYNYAIRSLAVVQQLLIGGLVLSSLGDWSSLVRRGLQREFAAKFGAAIASGVLALVLAASIALVSGRQLVGLLYQRGAFTSKDAQAVTAILLLALAGFCAEGVSMVVAQGLLALRRNRVTVVFGVTRFALRIVLVFPLALAWGARGVAVAYSLASVAMLAVQGAYLGRRVFGFALPFGGVMRSAIVACGTLGCAAVVAEVTHVRGVLSAAIVLAVFTGLIACGRPPVLRRQW